MTISRNNREFFDLGQIWHLLETVKKNGRMIVIRPFFILSTIRAQT